MSETSHGWNISSQTLTTIKNAYPVEQVLPLGVVTEPGQQHPQIPVSIPLNILNRHGLIAGATGTGKTRTLQLLAESLSAVGVPVLVTDVKGDLTGMGAAGQPNQKLLARTGGIGQAWQGQAFPVELLGLGEIPEGGALTHIPVRTTLTDIGPLLLAKILDLNTTQEQALQLIFAWADRQGLVLVDLADLSAVIQYLTGDGKAELKSLGGVSAATAGVILRAATVLASQGGNDFFGTPAFDTADLLRFDASGRGLVSILAIDGILRSPAIVSSLIMWLLADLFESLPEVGDLDKPKLVFFFDEVHLLFKNATPAFLDQVVQTVKLIRSKGVGIFFITQSPQDIPAEVLTQLGSRIVHGLRAFTPKDVADLKVTVQSFPLTDLPLDEVLTTLGTGEAVVTVLSERGAPLPVAPTRLFAPAGMMGPLPEGGAVTVVADSMLLGKYRTEVDPYSAFEKLSAQSGAVAGSEPSWDELGFPRQTQTVPGQPHSRPGQPHSRPEQTQSNTGRQMKHQPTVAEEVLELGAGMLKSTLRSLGTQLGREISRSLFGTRRRR